MRLRYKPNAIEELKKNELIILEPKEYKGRWREVFGNDNPISLEIGSGKGDFIKRMADENCNSNFIALEISIKAFYLAKEKFNKEENKNLRGIIADASDLEEIFDKEEISKIYLNFSTPWPKRRHHKRRLSHTEFLNRYKNIVKKDAILELKTDNREFFEDSLKYLRENDMEILSCNYDISIEDSKVLTEYEKKFRQKAVPICFLKARF